MTTATDHQASVMRAARPAELVELVELFFRGVFSSGLLITVVLSAFALALTPLQSADGLATRATIAAVFLAANIVALSLRARWYPLLRRHPSLIVAVGAGLAAGAALSGEDNVHLFYVLTLTLGVTGLAVPLRFVGVSAVLAALGTAAPHLAAPEPQFGFAVPVALIPVIFWIVIELLARFLLRFCAAEPASAAPTDAGSNSGRPGQRGRRRRRSWAPGSLRRGARLALPAPHLGAAADVSAPADDDVRLTARQMEAVLLCAEGLSHVQAAECLGVHPQQVRRLLRGARETTGVLTTAQLVAWAIRQGHVPGAR